MMIRSQCCSHWSVSVFSGSVSGKGGMTPLPLPPPHMAGMPPPGVPGNGSAHGTNQVLDYLEHQVRGMDVSSPLLQPQPSIPLQHPQHMPQRVPFSAGPPSMLSGLDDGPISRRAPPGSREARSSGSYQRYPRPAVQRSYSQEDMLDTRSRPGAYRPRSRSREDLLADERRGPSRRDDYSPLPRRGSWSSAADEGSRRGGARGGAWNDFLPSYSEYEPGKKPSKRPERFSVRVWASEMFHAFTNTSDHAVNTWHVLLSWVHIKWDPNIWKRCKKRLILCSI